MVTHHLQVERRTGKIRQPETAVLPLCHTVNLSDSDDNKPHWFILWDSSDVRWFKNTISGTCKNKIHWSQFLETFGIAGSSESWLQLISTNSAGKRWLGLKWFVYICMCVLILQENGLQNNYVANRRRRDKNSRATYRVAVSTGTKKNAGTDARVRAAFEILGPVFAQQINLPLI